MSLIANRPEVQNQSNAPQTPSWGTIAKRNVAWLGLIVFAGCHPEPIVEVNTFEPNYVYAYALGQNMGQPMDQALADTEAALTEFFGTPSEPKLPDCLKDEEDLLALVTLDHLKMAAGSPSETPNGISTPGLWKTHCASCHGVTGNGRGPVGALQNPYPRDYRMGVFKFKSTKKGAKPTREDLTNVIRHGLAGSGMVAYPQLTDDEVQALVDYVIYLSWRGELERKILQDAAFELDLEGDPDEKTPADRVYDPSAAQSGDEEVKEAFEDQLENIQDMTFDTGFSWLEAPDEVPEVDVPERIENVYAWFNDADAETTEDITKAADNGHQLFLGSIAVCHQCHGKEGKGDGTVNDYDAWTKDWINLAKIDPKDTVAALPYVVRGGLPPRNIMPRNLHDGVYRSGDKPEDLYRRIRYGIDGTPMPAAAMSAGDQPGLTEDDLWDLLTYVYSVGRKGHLKAVADAAAVEVETKSETNSAE